MTRSSKCCARFDRIAPHEERGVAGHDVQEEAFVGFGRGGPECRAVVKVHLDRIDVDAGAGHFRADAEREPLIRLNPDRKDVRIQRAGPIGVEQNGRDLFEMDGDLARPFRQSLSCAEKEGNAGPPPVVDGNLDRNVRLGPRLGGHAGFLAIPGHGFAHVEPGDVLRANDAAVDLLADNGSKGPQHFELLVTDHVGVE